MNKFEFEDLLLVLSERDETVMKSARNISGVKVPARRGPQRVRHPRSQEPGADQLCSRCSGRAVGSVSHG